MLAVSALAGAVPAQAEEIDFTCGENLTWSLNTETKTLIISGTGAMRDCGFEGRNAPWKQFSSYIETLIIEDGATSISQYAFYYCSSIKTAQIGEGVRSIGTLAFYGCSNLRTLELPSTLRSIGQQALCYTDRLSSITFPNGCGLFSLNSQLFKPGSSTITSLWYKLQPDGCVYIGDVLFDYKGTMPENTTLRVRDGTRVILADFRNQTNLVDLVIPDSVLSICGNFGTKEGTFDGTTWFLNQKQTTKGMIYAGKVAYKFSGAMQLGQEITLEEGTTGIAAYAFYHEELLTRLSLPSSLICIQSFGISSCTNLKMPDLSHIQYMYSYALENISVETLVVPASLRWAQGSAFSINKSTKHVIFENQSNLTELPQRIVANNSTEGSEIDIQLADNLEQLGAMSFYGLNRLKRIMIPPSVRSIEPKFASNQSSNEIKPIIQCFSGSAAHTFALENDYPYELLDGTVLNTNALNEQLSAAAAVARELYTDASLSTLDAAVAAVSLGAQTTQTTVDAWAEAIQRAIAALVYKPADYTAVNTQLQKAQALERELYTSASLRALDGAINAVDWTMTIVQQEQVNAFAQAIAAAIQSAAYRPADYDRVNAAVQTAQRVERVLYASASLAALDMAVSAVDYGLNITQQAQVDGYAAQIELAIESLTYCSVVLRNEPHGVLVSATAKEIHPETQLAVDEIDPSVYETADFAVGGHIKSVRYYDITLLRQTQIVQPSGTVQVKVRLSEGVDPAKCRVYHVTGDLVDPLVRVSSSLDGNYIVFSADHFSEYAVIEVETVLERIEVTAMPQKTSYALGESFMSSGLQVTAFFSDGTQRTVNDYDLSAVDTSSIGEKTVSVYYSYNGMTKSDRFTIRVTGAAVRAKIYYVDSPVEEYNKRVRLLQPYAQESVEFRCSVSGSEPLVIEWSSDNKKVRVDENGKVTNKGWFGARKATVTATVKDSAGNELTRTSITVRFYKFSFQLRKLEKQDMVYLPNRMADFFANL